MHSRTALSSPSQAAATASSMAERVPSRFSVGSMTGRDIQDWRNMFLHGENELQVTSGFLREAHLYSHVLQLLQGADAVFDVQILGKCGFHYPYRENSCFPSHAVKSPIIEPVLGGHWVDRIL